MGSLNQHKNILTYSMVVIGLISLLFLGGNSITSVQNGPAFIRQVRATLAHETGRANPAGLAFSSKANAFHVVEARQPGQPLPADTKVSC